MRILLAVDGSSFSDAAVEEVAQRPWLAATQIDVISVFEPPMLPTAEAWALPDRYYDELETAGRQEAQRVIEKAIARLRVSEKGLRIEGHVERGNPADVILTKAEEWGTNLIIVGSHGYRGFARLLLGSVSQAVASHAKCSVEIVRRNPVTTPTD